MTATDPGRTGLFLVSILLLAPPALPAGDETPPLRPVRFALLWTPQAQFAGVYVAVDQGFYERAGLRVEVLPGGPHRDPLAALREGRADFAVMWLSQALGGIEAGADVGHVAQLFRASNLAIAAWKDRIAAPADLDGRRVGVWEGHLRTPFSALFRSWSVRPRIVPQYATVNLFLLRGVDACAVMLYNEVHTLRMAGIDASELTVIPFRDHGIDFPADGIYRLRREGGPPLETGRALATLEGWRYAAAHEEEALGSVMRRVIEAKIPTSRAHQRWMLRTLIPSAVVPGEPAGTVTPVSRKAYEETVRLMEDQGELKSAPAYEAFLR